MELTSVFGQLRNLARRLEHGTADLKEKVENPSKYADDVSSANAYKHLQDMRKSVQSLKEESRDQLGNLQLSNSKMIQLLEMLPQVMAAQRQVLADTEEYLTQYGYTPREKKPAPSEKPAGDEEGPTEDDEDEGMYTINTNNISQQDSPPVKEKPSECKTPRLEDFGLSSFTLNRLQRGGAYTSQPAPPSQYNNLNSQVNMSRYETDESPTPLSFKHNGLLVTPSLLGGRSMSTETPDCTRTGALDFSMAPINFMEESPAPHTLQFRHPAGGISYTDQGSPIPPVLHTPGAKQINKKLYQEVKKRNNLEDLDSPIPPLLMTPGMKQISKCVTAPDPGVTRVMDDDSPAVPIMITPGSKQIQKSLTTRLPSPPAMSRSIFDEEPEMPQLTMSLHDITQLTQSFRLNQSNVSVPVTQSERLLNQATPTMPELLSTKLNQVDSKPNFSKGDNSQNISVLGVAHDNTPPPPMLLGKYSFLSKYNTQENIPPYGQ